VILIPLGSPIPVYQTFFIRLPEWRRRDMCVSFSRTWSVRGEVLSAKAVKKNLDIVEGRLWSCERPGLDYGLRFLRGWENV
jgi:hypothetical protein